MLCFFQTKDLLSCGDVQSNPGPGPSSSRESNLGKDSNKESCGDAQSNPGLGPSSSR